LLDYDVASQINSERTGGPGPQQQLRQLGNVHSNAPRLIRPSLDLDWDDDGNARRQSAAAMTRAATDAATMIKPMIVACTITIGAIY
jgi:hypothetical protein